MVLLTMTAPLVEAIDILGKDTSSSSPVNPRSNDVEPEIKKVDSLLESAEVGKPISHEQILDIWKRLRSQEDKKSSLEGLLRGTKVYVPPPPPKPEPTEEYKALMARLRREEEERSYERMTQKNAPTRESFAQRFPSAPMASAFAEVNRPSKESDLGDDFAVEYGDVQKQVTLIFNFLVSIIGCGVALWLAARWWSTPARLFLSLGGSIVVAVAEVAVYSAYSWRMAEGEKKEKKKKEVKEVMQTWVVGTDVGDDEKTKKKGNYDDDEAAAALPAPSAPSRLAEVEHLDDAINNLRRRMKGSS